MSDSGWPNMSQMLPGMFFRILEVMASGNEKLAVALDGMKKSGQERNFQSRVQMREQSKKVTCASAGGYLDEVVAWQKQMDECGVYSFVDRWRLWDQAIKDTPG